MKILVGYQGMNHDKNLLELAVKHAKGFDGEIIVVASLVGDDKTTPEKVLEIEEQLAKAKSFLDERGIKNEKHLLIRGNSAGEDIVDFASEKEADQIIIGVKNRSKVGKLLFGSTAQYVILKAPCPVLSVK